MNDLGRDRFTQTSRSATGTDTNTTSMVRYEGKHRKTLNERQLMESGSELREESKDAILVVGGRITLHICLPIP